MSRKTTGPRYWKSRKGFYCTASGQQVLLAAGEDTPENRTLAHEAYHRLMLSGRELSPSLKVRDAVGPVRRTSLLYFRQFQARFGEFVFSRLSREAVLLWVDSRKTWNESTKGFVCLTITAAANRNLGRGKHNLTNLCSKYRCGVRGEDPSCLMTKESLFKLLEVAPPHVKIALEFLYGTGCRPSEALSLEARHYEGRLGAFVLPKHKTSKKTSRKRVIYLPKDLEEKLLPLMELNPEGPLLRNSRGRRIRPEKLQEWVWRWAKKLHLGPVTIYTLRHLFGTEFLLRGGTLSILAELLGNTVKVVAKHYSHIGEHSRELLDEVRKFRG